ncbi:helix-turn-helix domain-containing protein [Kitasatospora sp. NBC_01302]|uniref:helix-turn-helix domain-containing protein n=1 Tax=Kitasatospora sp. NBC_01302 TaxID=2903575 RepID=UPI002E0D9F50|nr:pyridoxamine 5'-phosphate oxidase family protein [Kitasatospora sp. NBC_01302]
MSQKEPGRFMGDEMQQVASCAVEFMTRDRMPRVAAIEAARRAVPHGTDHDTRSIEPWVDAELPATDTGGPAVGPPPAHAPRPHPPARAGAADPGDLGRRVALRREHLGLSRDQVAERAGMAPGYLEYLETRPAVIGAAGLLRLAAALDTTGSELLGAGGRQLPPGRTPAAARPRLEELDDADCWAHLSDHGIGRLAYSTQQGPVVLPVNYRVRDGALLYRTAADSAPSRAIGRQIAFEADHVDEALSRGWSVLVLGSAEQVFDPAETDGPSTGTGPTPWAGGTRDIWIRVDPERTSGRAIRT